MTDVKRLLAEATPLPWVVQVPEPGHVYIDTHAYEGGPEPVVNESYRFSVADAALIVYAVNRLPDYEAAVEALERLVREEYPDLPLHEIAATWGHATDEEVAALARLRESVPA